MISTNLMFTTRNEIKFCDHGSEPAAWLLQSSRACSMQSYEKHSNPIPDVNISPFYLFLSSR